MSAFLILSFSSSSKSETLIDAIWLKKIFNDNNYNFTIKLVLIYLNNAQQSGVANVKQKPQNMVWMGAFAHGNFLRTFRFSSAFMRIGVNTERLIDKIT